MIGMIMPTMIVIQSIERPPLRRPKHKAPCAGPSFSAALPSVLLYCRCRWEFPLAPDKMRGDCCSSAMEGCCSGHAVRQSVFPFRAMDDSGRPAKDAPNPQEFGGEWQKLLEAFDSDPATALQKYQVARNGLVCVFRA